METEKKNTTDLRASSRNRTKITTTGTIGSRFYSTNNNNNNDVENKQRIKRMEKQKTAKNLSGLREGCGVGGGEGAAPLRQSHE
jgi:hypothetical protein